MATDRQDFYQWMSADEAAFNEEEFVSGYVAELELGSYRFVDLFRDIRPYVENENDLPGIAQALSFLPRLFNQLIAEEIPFMKSDKSLILSWLCQRVTNESNDPTFRAGIYDVIEAIRIISTSEKFSAENAIEVVNGIFALAAKLDYKDLKTGPRASILLLLQALFLRYEVRFHNRPGVSQFVTGLIDLAQFEKTPRCLGILFPIFTQLTKAWASDLEEKSLAKTMFTSFYRYFPIDVQRSLANDLGVPSLQELAGSLEECIVSSKIYAKYAFENLLGNLDIAQEKESKKKTLAMILVCVSTYDILVIQTWQMEIWNVLKYEIWQGEDEGVVEASLKILHQICKVLATETVDGDIHQASLTRYITDIGKECGEKTQDSMQWLIPNGRIFNALATSDLRALWYITKSTIPKTFLKWQDTSLPKEKGYLLISLTHILKAHSNIYDPLLTFPPDETKKLVFLSLEDCRSKIDAMYDEALQLSFNQQDGIGSSVDIPELYISSSKHEDLLVKTAVEGLGLLLDIPGYYPGLEGSKVIESIIQVHSKTADEGTRQQCISVLQHLTADNPLLYGDILNSLLTKIPAQIPDPPLGQRNENINVAARGLETMVKIGCASICRKEYLYPTDRDMASSHWYRNFEALVHKLLLKFAEVIALRGQYDYANSLLLAIQEALTRFEKCLDVARASEIEPKPQDPVEGPYTWIIKKIYDTLSPEQQRHERWDHTTEIQWYTYIRGFPDASERQTDRIVQSVGEITLLILRSKATTSENNYLLRWNNDFENNDCSALSSLFTEGMGGCDMMMMDEWQPDVRRGPREKCLANVLAMYMIAGTRPQDGNNLRIVWHDAIRFMMAGYIGFDIQAAAEYRDGDFYCSPLSESSMLWYIQLLVNKFGVATDGSEENTPFDILGRYVAEARSVTADVPMPIEKRERVLQVLAHFTAASMAAFDTPTMMECFRLMTACLEDPAPFGMMAARLFGIILEPSYILTRENFCKVRSVGPSWVLENIVLSLRLKWRMTEDATIAANYLIALAGLLQHIDPQDYIADQGEELLPAILEGTNIRHDASSKLIYLESINAYIKHDREVVAQHLLTVIRGLGSRLLVNLDDPSESPMMCRMAAVDILKTLMGSYGKERLMPFRAEIESEIFMACRDDAPAVRRKGQEASTLWSVWLNAEN